MIPPAFIQDLLSRLDIVDVVESHISLKRAGSNLVACCPFHGEKTPSFTVSPAKQFYHCFGCGAHGNAIGFVMEYSGLDFIEAVRNLAARLGLTVPEMRGDASARPPDAADGLTDVLHRAAVFYKAELKSSALAIDYLKDRGLTGEIAARYGLGYAPPGWQNLAALFPDYRAKSLVAAGLVIEADDGKRYDRFRDRIMFPIVNGRGDIIGFGGRVLAHGEPKYLNSPETSLFEKGRELYGLYQARAVIRASGRILVVEGYMDVVALAQHGIGDVVATLGTATTPSHVQKLLKQADRVVFCFDGDTAGRRAAWRALENSLGQLTDGKEVAFLFLPDGDDPDSYVRRAGRDAFEARSKEAVPLSAFLVRELVDQSDLQSEEGRARFLKSAKPLVRQISAPALSLLLRKRLAEVARVQQAEADSLFEIRGIPPSPRAPAGMPNAAPVNRQRKLLRCLLSEPQLAVQFDPALLDTADPDGRACATLLEFLAAHPDLEPRTVPAVVSDYFRASEHQKAFARAIAEVIELEGNGVSVGAEFADVVRQLQGVRIGLRFGAELSRKPFSELSSQDKLDLQHLQAALAASGVNPGRDSESTVK